MTEAGLHVPRRMDWEGVQAIVKRIDLDFKGGILKDLDLEFPMFLGMEKRDALLLQAERDVEVPVLCAPYFSVPISRCTVRSPSDCFWCPRPDSFWRVATSSTTACCSVSITPTSWRVRSSHLTLQHLGLAGGDPSLC